MLYKHIIDPCFTSHIGSDGIADKEFQSEQKRIADILKSLSEKAASGHLPLLTPSSGLQDTAEIQELADQLRSQFKHIVILGTGGSTLCAQALLGLKNRYTQQEATLHFADNIDPHSMQCLLDHLPLQETCFLVVSKSGTTLETIAQFVASYEAVRAAVKADTLASHFIIITDPVDNPLRQCGTSLGIKILDHPLKIGGRFSIFSNVALLPAAISGLDIVAIREGADAVLNDTMEHGDSLSEPVKGALVQTCLMKRYVHTTVMMPYIDRLIGLTTWFRQIWAESLGKQGNGSTPARGLGTLDQHSQLQLYLDGPRDKLFTLILMDQHKQGHALDTSMFGSESFAYLNGRTMGDALTASQEATRDTLIYRQLPVRTFTLETLDERVLGGLAMHLILETVITAGLLGIDPFDQPAVEEGKIRARKLLKDMA